MKFLKFIGLTGAGVLAYWIYTQYAKRNQLDMKIKKVSINRDKIMNLAMGIIPLRITTTISNPLELEARIKGVKLDVIIESDLLGTISKSFPESTKIKGKSKTDLNLDFDIDALKIKKTFLYFMDYFQGIKKGSIYLKGFIYSDLGNYQINQKYEL